MTQSHKPDTCLGCPLYDAPGPVWGHGPESAKMLILGEAPGHDEVTSTGRPFTGGSGRVLTAICNSVGLDRRTTYITNVVKCRPTVLNHLGEKKDRPPTREEITHCAQYLGQELTLVKPNLVLALGGTALLVFKDTDAIGKFRGIPFEAAGQKVLATFHPAALMRQQQFFPTAYWDIRRAVEESKSPHVVRVDVKYNPRALPGVDGPAMLEAARRARLAIFDLETQGPWGTLDGALDPRTNQIVCGGLGVRPREADCYFWNEDVKRLYMAILEDPDIVTVGQNSEGFDIPVLEAKGVKTIGEHWDTLQMFHLVNPDLPKDLGHIASYYTDMEYWKGEAKTGDLGTYNCKDIDATTRSYLGLRKEIQTLGMEDLYRKSVMPLQPVLRAMSNRGLRKDLDKAEIWSQVLRESADKYEATLRDGLGDPYFSVNSPKQLMALLYDKLGLPVQYVKDRVRGSRPTANDEAMEKLAEITNDEIFLLVNKVRQYRKFASTYCDVTTDEAGFIHPRFGTAKAGNGRLNSWDPNAQNWPLDLRELLIPDDEESVIISADWNQVEWRAAMAVAADKHGLEMFASGKDMHKTVGATFENCSYDAVTDDARHASKFIVYGWAYGRGAKDIAQARGREISWVQTFIRSLERTFPEYVNLRRLWEHQVRKNFYLRNPFDRRRYWYQMQVTEVFNFVPSSIGADMMYLTIPKVDRQLPKGASLRLTVHDELVVVAHRSVVKQSVECLKENMEAVFPQITERSVRPEVVKHFYPNGWYVPTDINIGESNWKQCKPKTPEEKAAMKALKKKYGIAV
jgi:uracil-DNA glycosylase family 4